ncbi:MAG: ATP synthase F1 subunit delta [Rickettsiales bacterium]
MSSEFVARKYGKALFNLALNSKKLSEISNDLEALSAAVNSSISIKETFSSPVLNKSNFLAFLDRISDKLKFHKITSSFLKVLFANGRMDIVDSIAIIYHELLLHHEDVLEFTITSAEKLTKIQLGEMDNFLRKITKKNVKCIHKVDPELIGGYTIRYKSFLIDDSVKNKLNTIKNISLSSLNFFELNQRKQ